MLELNNEEKDLIIKALDFMGNYVADKEGYSSGEKYWDIKDKLLTIYKN